jgi:hypothetical protein
MKKTVLEERNLAEAVETLHKNSFTVLDLMRTFKGLLPDERQALVE